MPLEIAFRPSLHTADMSMIAAHRPSVLFSASRLSKNGITEHIKTLSEGLLDRGWRVGIATRQIADGAPIDADFLAHPSVILFEIPYPDFLRSWGSAKDVFTSLRDLHHAIRRFEPDIVHVHGFGLTPFVFPSRRFHDIPLISTCHNTPPAHTRALAQRLAPINPYLNTLFGDRVVAISQQMSETLQALWKLSPQRIRLIPNGVDDTYFRRPVPAERQDARNAFDLAPDDEVVCLVGRVSYMKGHDVLVRAVAALHARGRPVIALCAGTGPRQQQIGELAAELGVADAVRLLGYTDSRAVMWASDLFVLPSRREGCPLVIPEAMLTGLVPIRTPAAGVEEQVQDGANGYIVPFDDPAALADRIEALFENREQRRAMGERARTTALEKFTASVMVERTIDAYRELMPVHSE